jgi:hydrogenase/urease accessory protein HupE
MRALTDALADAGGPALAHGVAATGQESIAGFVELGITHMLTGWDHVLFVVGVVLLAWQPRRAAGLLSLFALGHSTTLITATLAGWHLDPAGVDIVIAGSVAFVGTVGLFGRPHRYRWFGLAVLGFGSRTAWASPPASRPSPSRPTVRPCGCWRSTSASRSASSSASTCSTWSAR